MAHSWKDVKAELERLDRANGRDVAADNAHADNIINAYVLGFRLGQLREAAGLTQAELADRMGISQPRISQLEKGHLDQMVIGTIQRYVAALGGTLKIVADFEDHAATVSIPELDHSEVPCAV